MKRAVSDVESSKSQEMELRKYISDLEDKITNFDVLNPEMNSKLNSVLRELGELSQCKGQLDDSNSISLNEIDSKMRDYETLQSENHNFKAEMSRMDLNC